MNVMDIDLTKEQKQYLLLGGIGAILLIVLVVFSVRFGLSSVTAAKVELEELSKKIEHANKQLSKHGRVAEDFEKTVAVLQGRFENIPPERNFYSWATEIIYTGARSAELEVDAVEEIATPQTAVPAKPVVPGGIEMQAYSLRITAHGGYESIKRFLHGIEQSQPLARLTGLEISKGKNPETHDIQLYMQWPMGLTELARIWSDVEQKRQALVKNPRPAKPSAGPVESPVVAQAPQVSAPVPEPEPVPARAEPLAQVADKPILAPEPAAVAVAPKVAAPAPVPADVQAPRPEPAQVAVQPAPKPEPVVVAPPVVAPAPVPAEVQAPRPEPAQVAVQPAPKPEPVVVAPPVVAPAPVPAEVQAPRPEPAQVAVQPAPKPEPVVVAPPVVAPAPVVAAVPVEPIKQQEPAAEPASQPNLLEEALAALMAAEPAQESSTEAQAPAQSTAGGDAEGPLAGLLKSLPAEADAGPTIPKPVVAVEPVPAQVARVADPEPDRGSADLAGLLLAPQTAQPAVEPVVPVAVPVPVPEHSPNPPAEVKTLESLLAAAQSKPVQAKAAPAQVDRPPAVAAMGSGQGQTASTLEGLLQKQAPKPDQSLKSFLNAVVEEINE